MKIVILGLSITSSWGNGHATTYRGLVRELVKAGHEVLFLERDVPWYAGNRDLPIPPYGKTCLYDSLDELRDTYTTQIRDADAVMVGSYVPEGIEVGEWVISVARGATAFYDIDTPVTHAALAKGACEYLSRAFIPEYDLYLSFTGGSTLQKIEQVYGSPCARALYCSFDPELYYPEAQPIRWDLAYMGTYSADRQPTLEKLLLEPAEQWQTGRFAVVGPQYPADLQWGQNVERISHLPPSEHRAFYNSQRFTLNITRADMIQAGYSPSVRLFEAAACGVPIISDWWEGLDTLLVPSEEILIAQSSTDILRYLQEISEARRCQIAERARARVLSEHTAAHRAAQLEQYFHRVIKKRHKG